MPCHAMRCDSPCTLRPSPHKLSHTTPKTMCDKLPLWMISNDHFQNKLHLFINQNLFRWYITMIIFFSKSMHLYVGSGFSMLRRGLYKPRHFYGLSPRVLCLTIIGELFSQGRIYPFLLIPDTYFHYHFIQPCYSVGRCPIYRAHPIKH